MEGSIRSIPYIQRVRYPYHWEEELETGVIYSAGAFLSFTIMDWGDSHNLFVSLGGGLWFSEVYYESSGAFFLVTPENTQYEADNYLKAGLAYSLAVKPGLRFLVKPNFQFVGNFELDDRSSIARKFFLYSSLDVGLMIAL